MPPVARRYDPGITHCSGYTMATASNNVFVNDRGAVRVGDSSTSHQRPGGKNCVPHVSQVASGRATVFVNDRPIARKGDPLTACTQIAQGSGDVSAG